MGSRVVFSVTLVTGGHLCRFLAPFPFNSPADQGVFVKFEELSRRLHDEPRLSVSSDESCCKWDSSVPTLMLNFIRFFVKLAEEMLTVRTCDLETKERHVVYIADIVFSSRPKSTTSIRVAGVPTEVFDLSFTFITFVLRTVCQGSRLAVVVIEELVGQLHCVLSRLDVEVTPAAVVRYLRHESSDDFGLGLTL